MVVPAPTVYHRLLGWHAPALRRLAIAASVGLILAAVLSMIVTWRVAVLGGWDAAALTFLVTVWPMILRTDGPRTQHLATREDMNRDTATLLLLVACAASLVAVSFALGLARQETGAERVSLVTIATLTVVVSWTVVNTVFTLRYAHLYYRSPAPASGIDFGETTSTSTSTEQADYRDFAYLAFTIGMTYQVSDTTLRDRRIRHTVLLHAILSYVFGVVIVAAGVNVVAGLVG
jgi:uncharacterized membrane protein